MESRVIQLKLADIKNGKLNVRPCGLDFFPPGILGGSSKNKLGTQITIKVAGFPNPITTDIPTNKITGTPRWFFRKRNWVKEFVRYHRLCPGDNIIINRLDKKTYKIVPSNKHDQPQQTQLLATQHKWASHTQERNPTHMRPLTKPTRACDVTPDTPIECLNLNWSERDLPERQRTKHVHRLHPYLGKYIPQLVEIFLRKFFSPGETILDPFVGSGTALVQANELGINSIGYDVSAFNILLSRVKTSKYDVPKARREVLDILKKVRFATHKDKRQKTLFGGEVPDTAEKELYETDNQYLKKWFAPQALRELLMYRHLIESGTYEYADLLWVILSRSARSARLTTHFDLDFPKRPQREPYWCYKHSRTCFPIQEAYKFLHRYSLDTLQRIEEFAEIRTEASVELYHGDSRSMAVSPIHGVITSPPYVGLIDYHDQHAYSYHLLGLTKNSDNEIGSPRKGNGPKAKQEYKRDIAAVFKRALDAMPSGRHLIVVAQDRAELYGEISRVLGVNVDGIVKRHVNRRTGRRAGDFYESVFLWRKP